MRKEDDKGTLPKISKITVEIHESFAVLRIFTSKHIVCVGDRRRRGRRGAIHNRLTVPVGSCIGVGTTPAANGREHGLYFSKTGGREDGWISNHFRVISALQVLLRCMLFYRDHVTVFPLPGLIPDSCSKLGADPSARDALPGARTGIILY